MDIISQNNSLKCTSHPNSEIIFIKINDLNNSNQILYCEMCIEKLDSFKPQNFLRVKKILSPDSYSFIPQWPPLDNSILTKKINQIISNIEQSQDLELKIKNFFDEFKRVINSKIDNCQKSMLRIASEIPEQNEKIIENLKDVSKVINFQNILQNTQLDNQGKEKQLREFINESHNQKHKQLEQFINISKEFDEQNRKINFETPNDSKSLVLSLIEGINFFDEINYENEQKLIDENEQKQIDLNQKNNLDKQIEDILPNLQMVYKNNVKITQNDKMEIKKLPNNQIEIINQKLCRCYSSIILNKNKKYIFRLSTKVYSFQDQRFLIGLVEDKYRKQKTFKGSQFYRQRFDFLKANQQLSVQENGDFIKEGEGDSNDMNEFMNVEIRVHLKQGIFEILDYPNYKCKFSLCDKEKINLKNNKYRFYLSLIDEMSITVESVFICEQFED